MELSDNLKCSLLSRVLSHFCVFLSVACPILCHFSMSVFLYTPSTSMVMDPEDSSQDHLENPFARISARARAGNPDHLIHRRSNRISPARSTYVTSSVG